MHKAVDTSELTEQQRANLVVGYFDELAKIYNRRATALRERGEPISDLVDVLESKENDVLKLKGWVNIIVNQHISKKMGESLSQSGISMQQAAARRVGFDMVMGAEALLDLLSKAKVEAERLRGSFNVTKNMEGVERVREIATGLETVLFILQRLTYTGVR